MDALSGTFEFAAPTAVYPDGNQSNFVFSGYGIARPVWRYVDLTRHVGYLADLLVRTIRQDMHQEARYLQSHEQARAMIKEIIEMPDFQIDGIIRSVHANKGALSNALAQEVPLLNEAGIWASIVQAVERAFAR